MSTHLSLSPCPPVSNHFLLLPLSCACAFNCHNLNIDLPSRLQVSAARTSSFAIVRIVEVTKPSSTRVQTINELYPAIRDKLMERSIGHILHLENRYDNFIQGALCYLFPMQQQGPFGAIRILRMLLRITGSEGMKDVLNAAPIARRLRSRQLHPSLLVCS
jgi:hypothetical protein